LAVNRRFERSIREKYILAAMKLFTFLVIFVVLAFAGPVRAEEPAAAAARFYREYMAPGVALKPLGERWYTARFQGVIDALDKSGNDPLQKPTEGGPILPRNWDSSWRNKLKAEVLHASPDRAQVLVTFATDDNGRPIARLVHLEKAGDAWRVDDVIDAPR
jgi:hypothetical protein